MSVFESLHTKKSYVMKRFATVTAEAILAGLENTLPEIIHMPDNSVPYARMEIPMDMLGLSRGEVYRLVTFSVHRILRVSVAKENGSLSHETIRELSFITRCFAECLTHIYKDNSAQFAKLSMRTFADKMFGHLDQATAKEVVRMFVDEFKTVPVLPKCMQTVYIKEHFSPQYRSGFSDSSEPPAASFPASDIRDFKIVGAKILPEDSRLCSIIILWKEHRFKFNVDIREWYAELLAAKIATSTNP